MADDPLDPILAGVQAALDVEGQGWQVNSFVLIIGAERLAGGGLEQESFRYTAPNQAPWVTNGLLEAAEEYHVEEAQ